MDHKLGEIQTTDSIITDISRIHNGSETCNSSNMSENMEHAQTKELSYILDERTHYNRTGNL